MFSAERNVYLNSGFSEKVAQGKLSKVWFLVTLDIIKKEKNCNYFQIVSTLLNFVLKFQLTKMPYFQLQKGLHIK